MAGPRDGFLDQSQIDAMINGAAAPAKEEPLVEIKGGRSSNVVQLRPAKVYIFRYCSRCGMSSRVINGKKKCCGLTHVDYIKRHKE